MAQDNFEEEMRKHRDYFRKYNVFTLIYTDEKLMDCNALFEDEILQYLQPEKPTTQLSRAIL
jgi:hypothetical protein